MKENVHPNILDEPEFQPPTPPPEEEDADLRDFLSSVEWKGESIEEELFDPTQPDIDTSYTLEWADIQLAPLGGLCGLNGQPGHGKTMTFSMLIAAIIKGEYEGIRCLLPGEPSVLYIDTEMEKVNTQRTVRRIYQMVGWPQRTNQPRLNTMMLREVNDATTRWRKILKAVWQLKPTVVFLDGLIDVVADFNDNVECQERIYQCMAVASHYNISLWTLLHLNPGSEKAVGHLGSFLERKATDILINSMDDETALFTVKHKKHRYRKAPDITFKIENPDGSTFGIPKICRFGSTPNNPLPAATAFDKVMDEDAAKRKEREFEQKVRTIIKSLHWTMAGMRYIDLEDELKANGVTSNRQIENIRKKALEKGLIRQEQVNKRYYLNQSEIDAVDTQETMALSQDGNSMGDDNGSPF